MKKHHKNENKKHEKEIRIIYISEKAPSCLQCHLLGENREKNSNLEIERRKKTVARKSEIGKKSLKK